MTLHKMVEECNTFTSIRQDTAMIQQQQQSKSVVNKVQFGKQKPKVEQSIPQTQKPKYPCWNCGEMHFVRNCGYSKHQCQQCRKLGHKDGYCSSGRLSKPQNQHKKGKRSAQTATSRRITAVNQVTVGHNRKFIAVNINNKPIQLQFDTASDITVISRNLWERIGRPHATATDFTANSASGNEMRITYEFDCDVTFNGNTERGKCYVTELPDVNLFGIEWIDLFHLWEQPISSICHAVHTPTIQHRIRKLELDFPSVFSTELGRCTKVKVKLHLKPGAKPIFRKPRPVSYASLTKMDKEIDRLLQRNII